MVVGGSAEGDVRRAMQERFIEWVDTHADVHWVCMADMAREFREKNPPPAGARMPRGMEAA